MATLKVWTDFSKRKNSTKQPTGGTDIEVKLKENTSIENPVFICNNLGNANYCQYANNYYFVDDIVFVTSSIVELHCTMDALATNKSSIVGSPAFVRYYTHNNTEIVDGRLATKTSASMSSATGNFDTFGATPAENSAVVITVVGKGNIGQFAMSQATVKDLMDDTMSDAYYNGIFDIEAAHPYGSDILDNVAVAFQRFWEYIKLTFNSSTFQGQLLDGIKSAVQIPLSVSDCGGNETSINIGGLNTNKTGYLITNRIFSDSATVNIPWQSTDWRKNSPYHHIYLYIPFIGVITLNPSDLINDTSLTVHVSLDKFTGACIFSVKSNSGKVIYYGSTNVASNYPIGSSNISPLECATSMLATASGIASSNPIATASGFIGIANSIEPNYTCIGSNTGSAGQGLNANQVTCWTVFHNTTVEPSSVSAIQGTPFNGVMNIPSSGYVQTVNADIQSIAYGSEKDAINAMLDSGIYIE